LLQYNFDIYYIPGKTNIVFNALFKLKAFELKDISEDNTLDDIFLILKALIIKDFKKQLTKSYSDNLYFYYTLRLLSYKSRPLLNNYIRLKVLFVIKDSLLYNTTIKGLDYLYVPDFILQEILNKAYNK
jgi:hypothetical protein